MEAAARAEEAGGHGDASNGTICLLPLHNRSMFFLLHLLGASLQNVPSLVK